MLKCTECGEVFTEDEIKTWSEGRGECWGQPAYEEMEGCPACKGSFEEAEECPICGEYFLKDELFGGMCDSCLLEKSQEIDYDIAFDFLKDGKDFYHFFYNFYFTEDVFEDRAAEIQKELEELFKRKVIADKLNGNEHFLDCLKSYVKYYRFDWAEFISEGVSK